MHSWIRERFSLLKQKDFTGFLLIQTLSLIGKWSHDLARAWVVIEIIGQAGALGAVSFCTAIPCLCLILPAGSLINRLDIRRVLMTTQMVLALVSLSLAFVVEFGSIKMWMFYSFAFIEGLTLSFDSPAYQLLKVRLVKRKDIQQAIALYSASLHWSRAIGPLLAGLLMAWGGAEMVFLFDGVTYIVLIIFLNFLRSDNLRYSSKSEGKSLQNGFRYIYHKKRLRYMLIQLFWTMSCIIPLFVILLRVYIKKKFDLNAEEFGYFFTIPSLGATLGAITFTIIKPRKLLWGLFLGVPGSCFTLAFVPLLSTPLLSTLVMGVASFFSYLCFISLTSAIHIETRENFRAQVSSLIGMGFIGIVPLISYPIGVLADNLGDSTTLYLVLSSFLSGSILLMIFYNRS